MAKYAQVSAKQVLAQLIRGLNYKLPSTYIDDVLEWLAEGIALIQITNSLVETETSGESCAGELYLRNFCCELPCGFVTAISLWDTNGNQMSEDSYIKNMGSSHAYNTRVSAFEVNPFTHQTSDGLPTDEAGERPPFYIDGSDIEPESHIKSKYTYQIVGNRIQSDLEEGWIKMRYYSLPVDKEGYPLIPDNQNFKLALEWYLLKRLIGSGYKHDVFSYEYADNQHDKYSARAMDEVSYYSPDGARRLNQTLIRLLPPINYQNEFFR